MSPNGINHLALASSDIKKTLQYFNEVLGMPLASLYWMHGVEETVHGFLVLNENCLLAFVGSPKISNDVEYGVTHSGNPGDPCVGGTMQHLALNVNSLEDLLAVRDRIRSKGLHCMGPMDHGMMQSIYFAGPDSMTLEIAYLTGEDPSKWIDPAVVEYLNISKQELEELRNPTPYTRPSEPVQNPSLKEGNTEFRMHWPEAYDMFMTTPDDLLVDLLKDNVPPTEISPEDANKGEQLSERIGKGLEG
ncbi:VOC family protein [Amphritea japonica]|nr:VOC family protein [Amphritea japonica]